jgi:hypothetical protein
MRLYRARIAAFIVLALQNITGIDVSVALWEKRVTG